MAGREASARVTGAQTWFLIRPDLGHPKALYLCLAFLFCLSQAFLSFRTAEGVRKGANYC